MNIILCGFMGSGKSTIGKLLARQLNAEFIDLDDYIVEKRGMTISDIFSKYGEENFRKSETQAAKNISKLDNLIVSLGGGTVVNPKNAEILKTSGKIILLYISPETVYQRLKNDKSRPLLQTKDKLKAITDMLEKRMPYYDVAADYKVNVDGKTKEEVLKEILKIIENF